MHLPECSADRNANEMRLAVSGRTDRPPADTVCSRISSGQLSRIVVQLPLRGRAGLCGGS